MLPNIVAAKYINDNGGVIVDALMVRTCGGIDQVNPALLYLRDVRIFINHAP